MVQVRQGRRFRVLLLAVPVAAWAAVLYWLSAQPASAFQEAGLTSVGSGIPGRNYLVHVGLYGVLGGLLWLWARFGLRAGRWRALAMAVGLAVLYGIFDEWHQSFVPGRTPDALDVVADGVGALLAAASLWGVEIAWRKRFKSPVGDANAGR